MLGVLYGRIERMSAGSEAPEAPSPPVYLNADAHPFIYFDVVAAYGVLAGSIEIELAARILSPAEAGRPVEFITSGVCDAAQLQPRNCERRSTRH